MMGKMTTTMTMTIARTMTTARTTTSLDQTPVHVGPPNFTALDNPQDARALQGNLARVPVGDEGRHERADQTARGHRGRDAAQPRTLKGARVQSRHSPSRGRVDAFLGSEWWWWENVDVLLSSGGGPSRERGT